MKELFQAFQKMRDATESLVDVIGGIAIGRADEALAAETEGGAGDDGDALGVEQAFAEFLGGEPR